MNDWRLRLARVDEASAFHEIETDAAAALAGQPILLNVPLPPPRTEDEYASLIAKRHCLTALIEDRPVGFAACMPVGRSLHIAELSVARAHQRRGVGAGLLRAVGIDALNGGFDALTLDTFREVALNAPFYARHGFVEVENFENWPHLRRSLDDAVARGMPADKRIAMVRFLR